VRRYRTPLDFISRRRFHIDNHWAYYAEVSQICRVPLFNRRVATIPWDRIPSDIWHPPEGWVIPFGLAIQIPFCLSFLGAWNFQFPSGAEMWLWRACSIFHAGYSVIGTGYYMFGSLRGRADRLVELRLPFKTSLGPKDKSHSLCRRSSAQLVGGEPPGFLMQALPGETARGCESSSETCSSETCITDLNGPFQSTSKFSQWHRAWRNISPDQDPEMEVPIRWTVILFVASVLYIFCRLYFYTEDFIGLRSQPPDVYRTVKLIPIF
jgi:hypothetical protein